MHSSITSTSSRSPKGSLLNHPPHLPLNLLLHIMVKAKAGIPLAQLTKKGFDFIGNRRNWDKHIFFYYVRMQDHTLTASTVLGSWQNMSSTRHSWNWVVLLLFYSLPKVIKLGLLHCKIFNLGWYKHYYVTDLNVFKF